MILTVTPNPSLDRTYEVPSSTAAKSYAPPASAWTRAARA